MVSLVAAYANTHVYSMRWFCVQLYAILRLWPPAPSLPSPPPQVPLVSSDPAAFTRGHVDTFKLRLPDVGSNKKATVRLAPQEGATEFHSGLQVGARGQGGGGVGAPEFHSGRCMLWCEGACMHAWVGKCVPACMGVPACVGWQ